MAKNRVMRKLTMVLISMVFIAAFFGQTLAATKLAKTKLSLTSGNAYVLKLKGNKYKPKWKSSKPGVVQVVNADAKQALLSTKKAGKAVITVKAANKTYKCTITVKKKEAAPKKLTLIAGDKFKIVLPKKANWSSGKKTVVKLSAKNRKTVTIKAGKAAG